MLVTAVTTRLKISVINPNKGTKVILMLKVDVTTLSSMCLSPLHSLS